LYKLSCMTYKYPISTILHQVSYLNYLASSILSQLSCIKYPISSSLYKVPTKYDD
jgi:hypothetical protein